MRPNESSDAHKAMTMRPESMFIERDTGLPIILFEDWDRMSAWQRARYNLFGKLPDWVRRADEA